MERCVAQRIEVPTTKIKVTIEGHVLSLSNRVSAITQTPTK